MKKKLFLLILILFSVIRPIIIFAINIAKTETFWERIMKEESNYNIQKGILYMQNEEYSKASIEFSKALDKNPSSLGYALLGSSLYWMGDIEGSIKEYEKAIKLDPQNAIPWQLRGISMAKLQDIDSALGDFEKALSLDPKRADVYMNIGSIYFAKGHMSKAQYYIKKAIKIDPSNPLFYYQLGLVYFYLERYEEAELNFEKAISIYRDYEEAIVWAGISKERQGNYSKAIEYYKKAINLKPYDFFARYKMALALLNLNRKKEIQKYIEKCFLLTPTNPRGGISLSISYAPKEKKDKVNNTNEEEEISEPFLKGLEKNLMRVPGNEEILFNIDVIVTEKPGIETVTEKKLVSALSNNFRPLVKKYISKSFFIPSTDNLEKRKELIISTLKVIEKQFKENNDKNYRINFTMNTKKTKPENKMEDNSVAYYPRNIGNDMGLWIIGNNWLSIVEEDIETLKSKNENFDHSLITGLAYILIGEGEMAEKYFQKSLNVYPALSKLGLGITYVFEGNEEKAIILFEEILKLDKKNEIAAQNLKWLKVNMEGKKK